MLNKLLILGVCLVGLIWLLIHFEHNNESDRNTDSKAVTTVQQNAKLIETAQRDSEQRDSGQTEEAKSIELASSQFTPEQQNILAEIEIREFSDDAYIELVSLGLKVGFCSNEFDIPTLFNELGDNYQQQQDLAETLKKTCEGYRKQYKNILSMSEKELKKLFQPTSQLGRLLKAQSDKNSTSVERVENLRLTMLYALKEKNSSLLVTAAFMQRFGGGNLDPLIRLLNSNDISYLGQMSQLALVLLSCQHQNGQSCSSTSMVMVLVCSQYADACGLDFQTWYQNNTMPGMKRDVEKLMAYYQQLSS